MALTLEQIEELFVYPLICRRKTRTFCHHSAIHTALSHINTTILYTLNTFFFSPVLYTFPIAFHLLPSTRWIFLLDFHLCLSITHWIAAIHMFSFGWCISFSFFFHSCAVLRFSIQCMCILPRVGASIPCKSRWNAANLMASNFFLWAFSLSFASFFSFVLSDFFFSFFVFELHLVKEYRVSVVLVFFLYFSS